MRLLRFTVRTCSARESMHQPIIPGLPDDLGIWCLAMLSHGYHGVMESVSKRWRDVMRGEEYANYKAREGWCGDWLFVLTEYQWIAYDPEADRWHPLPPAPYVLLYGTVMHVLGCHCFDPFKKEWSTVTSMRTPRSHFDFASCTMDGKIYVAGGRNSDYLLGMNLAEVYDPLTDKWEDLPPMPVPMMSCRGIAYTGKFHVIDVCADNRGLCQIQVFDPLSRNWHVKHENWSPSLNQVAIADDQVYSMDGLGGSTVERRDAEKDEWHIVGEVPPLFDPNNSKAHARLYYELASLGHELYVMAEKYYTMMEDSEAEDMVGLGRVRVCEPRCLPLIWRETRPMCRNASGFINGWASLKQQ